MDVEQLGKVRRAGIGDHVLHEEDPATPLGCLVLVLENLHAFVVVPIMQDQFHEVGVSGRDSLEHIAWHIFTPVVLFPCVVPTAGRDPK